MGTISRKTKAAFAMCTGSHKTNYEGNMNRESKLLCMAATLVTLMPVYAPSAPPQYTTDKHTTLKPTLLVSGLEGSLGSTIGPDGALYIPEGTAGRISRI